MTWSSLIKLFLLFTTVLQVSKAAGTIARHTTEFTTKNPFTVAIGSELFTVSRLSRRVIVNSTAENYKSCDIPVNTNQGPVDITIKAAAIGSKKIVVLNKKSYDFAPGTSKIFVNYTILLVDPWACNVQVVPSPMELVSTSAPFEPPQITVRDDNTFDIFYWSQTICSPCRYDIEGRRVQLGNSVNPERSSPLDFYLHELSDEKYAYTFNFGNDKTVLKVLDRDFKVLDLTDLKPVVKDFAVNNVAGASYIGAVQKVSVDRSTYNYTLFEYKNKLRLVFSKLYKMPFGVNLNGAIPQIDSKGFSYVTLWKDSIDNQDTNITLSRYDLNGQVLNDAVDIGKVAFNQQRRIQSFVLEDKQYCLVVHEIGWKSDVTKIKCYDV